MLNEWLVQRSLVYRFNSKWTISNFSPFNWWECDIYSINNNMFAKEIEIKLSVADFRQDFKKNRWERTNGWVFGNTPPKELKHDLLAGRHGDCPNMFYYCMPVSIAEKVNIPEYAGLMTFNYSEPSKYSPRGNIGYIEIIKQAPKLHTIKVDPDIMRQLAVASNRRYLKMKFYDTQVNMGI